MLRRRPSPTPSSNSNNDGAGRQAGEEPIKSKKPANTAFRQQRLRAWQPVLTPRIIILVWSILAVTLLAAGGVLYWLSTTVRDFALDYTRCSIDAPTDAFGDVDPGLITAHFGASDPNLDPKKAQWRRTTYNRTVDGVNLGPFSSCSVKLNIPENLEPPIVMYYKLDNFYQNHRRYVNSFDSDQLKGKAVTAAKIQDSNCDQLATVGSSENRKAIYPCGLIANSLFNDTFENPLLLNTKAGGGDNQTFTMTDKSGIAWESEKDLYGMTSYGVKDVVPPPNWYNRYPNGYTENNTFPDLSQWPAFQVWMRTAATAVFTKPYQRNDSATMQSGQYLLEIEDNFNVTAFNGKKSFVFSTLSALGGRNPWVGVIFLVTGGFCLIMTAVFSVGHLLRPRKMGDHTYLSWNNVSTTGAATGTDVGRGGIRQR